MAKRKERNKLSKTMDITKPITIEMIGGKDDPCFGKSHDARHPTCQKCGDAELCCLMMGQKNHNKRSKVEALGGSYRDIEDSTNIDLAEIKKLGRKRIRELVKRAGKTGVDKNEVIQDVHAIYFDKGLSTNRIEKLITRLHDKGIIFIKETKNKTTLVWKA